MKTQPEGGLGSATTSAPRSNQSYKDPPIVVKKKKNTKRRKPMGEIIEREMKEKQAKLDQNKN